MPTKLKDILEKVAENGYHGIQSIIRNVLKQYREFYIQWTTNPATICEATGLTSKDSPTIAYNKTLELNEQKLLRSNIL
jgi:hypothetical protein